MGNLREIFDKHLPFEEAFVHRHLKHIAGDVGVFIWKSVKAGVRKGNGLLRYNPADMESVNVL